VTEQGKRVLESVRGRPELSRSVVEGFARKLRQVYGDEAAAKELDGIAAEREDPPSPPAPFFCKECGGALCAHAPEADEEVLEVAPELEE
jgi:hypothetical protein